MIVSAVKPSTDVAVEIQTKEGIPVRILLLSPQQAANCWKVRVDSREHLLMTRADVYSDDETLHLRSRDVKSFSFSIFPWINGLDANAPLQETGHDGLFARYEASVKSGSIPVAVEKLRDPAPAPPVRMGRVFDWRNTAVAEAPDDAEFEKAGVWRLTLPENAWNDFEDVFLSISYVGDVGRVYDGKTLVDDNFFDGTPWEIGLKRFGSAFTGTLDLQILPLRKDAPIYVPKHSWPAFDDKSEVAVPKSVVASPEYDVILKPRR